MSCARCGGLGTAPPLRRGRDERVAYSLSAGPAATWRRATLAGLNPLAGYQSDYLKLDIKLVRGIHRHAAKQAIVEGVLQVCDKRSIEPPAEGVEMREEPAFLRSLGIRLFQGFYFAKPGFECLPVVAPELFDPAPGRVPEPAT